jgi:hypothetical protein
MVDEAAGDHGRQRKAGCAMQDPWRAANAAAARRTRTGPASFGGRSRCVQCAALHRAQTRKLEKGFKDCECRVLTMPKPAARLAKTGRQPMVGCNSTIFLGAVQQEATSRFLVYIENDWAGANLRVSVACSHQPASQSGPFTRGVSDFKRPTQGGQGGATPSSPPAHAIKSLPVTIRTPYLPYLCSSTKRTHEKCQGRGPLARQECSWQTRFWPLLSSPQAWHTHTAASPPFPLQSCPSRSSPAPPKVTSSRRSDGLGFQADSSESQIDELTSLALNGDKTMEVRAKCHPGPQMTPPRARHPFSAGRAQNRLLQLMRSPCVCACRRMSTNANSTSAPRHCTCGPDAISSQPFLVLLAPGPGSPKLGQRCHRRIILPYTNNPERRNAVRGYIVTQTMPGSYHSLLFGR